MLQFRDDFIQALEEMEEAEGEGGQRDEEGQEGEGDEGGEGEMNEGEGEINEGEGNNNYNYMIMAMANQMLAEKLEEQQLEDAIKASIRPVGGDL